MSSTGILIVTGASGAGKSTTLRELDARAIPGLRCFHFDSIGIPTREAMEREHGSGEQWQAAAANAAASAAPRMIRVALFDCDPQIRSERLAGPRQQPELATAEMDRWAAYLRGQADALGLPVIDTSKLSIIEAADELETLVRQHPSIAPE